MQCHEMAWHLASRSLLHSKRCEESLGKLKGARPLVGNRAEHCVMAWLQMGDHPARCSWRQSRHPADLFKWRWAGRAAKEGQHILGALSAGEPDNIQLVRLAPTILYFEREDALLAQQAGKEIPMILHNDLPLSLGKGL